MKRLLPLLLVLGAFFSQQSAQAQGTGVYIYGMEMYVDSSITIRDSLTIYGDIVDRGRLYVVNSGSGTRVDSILYCKIDTYGAVRLNGASGLYLKGDYFQYDSLWADMTSKIEFYGPVNQKCLQTSSVPKYKFGHLIVNTPSIDLQSDMTIMPGGVTEFYSTGTRNNIITTGGNKLIMEANAGLSAEFTGFEASVGDPAALHKNYVFGTVWYHTANYGKTSYSFPVGDIASLNLMKLDFSANTIQDNSVEMLEVNYGVAPDVTIVPAECSVTTPDVYTRVWEYIPYKDTTGTTRLDTIPQTKGTYTITLNPRNYTVDTSTPKKNFIAYFMHQGDADYHTHKDTTSKPAPYPCLTNSVEHNQLVTPSMWKFSKAVGVQSMNDNTPFPNNNITLNANAGRNNINLGWQVEIPREVSFFNLERSTDGRNFQTIQANITAESSRNNYAFTDRNVKKNQTYFYRVKVSTTTNEAVYTRIVQAKVSELGQQSTNLQTNLYPNPTDGSLNLEINAGDNETVGLKIVDAIGRVVLQKNLDVENGTNRFDLTGEVVKLTGGTYNLVLTSESGISTTKLVKN